MRFHSNVGLLKRYWKNLSALANTILHECEIAILNAQTVILNSFLCWLNEWAFRSQSHCGKKVAKRAYTTVYVTIMYCTVWGFTYVLQHVVVKFNKYSRLSFSSFEI